MERETKENKKYKMENTLMLNDKVEEEKRR